MKNETLKNIHIAIEDKLEEQFRENSKLVKEIAELKNNLVNKTKYAENKMLSEKCDEIVILESTLENRVNEIEAVTIKLADAFKEIKVKDEELKKIKFVPFPCNQCHLTIDTENEFSDHNKERHEFTCISCDFKFEKSEKMRNHVCKTDKVHGQYRCKECELVVKEKEKLEKHICKLNLNNPSFNSLYLKNWIVKESCIPVFCNNLKKEVAILHNRDCYGSATIFRLKKENICQDLPNDFVNMNPDNPDTKGVFHLELNTYK